MNKLISFILFSIFLFGNKDKNPDPEHKIIMAIFAHADDELDVAPLLAQYAAKGHDVYLVIATKGEKGTNDHANIPAGDSLANVRKREVICACEKLGIKEPILLGMEDGNLTNMAALSTLHFKIDSLFSSYQPDVIITWGTDGGYGHTDHRMVHNVITDIYQTGFQTKPEALFYTGIPSEHWNDLPPYQTEFGKGSHKQWKPVSKSYLTTRIPYDEVDFNKAVAANNCYRSQFRPEEIEDGKIWLKYMNQDTVFLRPFSVPLSVSYDFD